MRNQSDKPYFSYCGQYSFLPLYKSLGIDNPTTIEERQSFTHLVWPEGNDCLSQTVQSFSELVVELDVMVMKMLCEIYCVGSYHDSYVGTKDGQWIDVEMPPSSYIVMAGDAHSWWVWSNDRIPSCYHQVIMTEKEMRYSTGMFSFVTGMIHIPEELADESHPPSYKPFDHFSFLHFNKEEGKKFPCSIKAYCGI
ncbi:hypothetical protein SLEP1_g43883 [Rubroshorea leprosula]|uniref:Isopenicillin N synthase-like Fe(2+) 2OG dioxygenase domain-containing protein n=1 Tax=Rubroshorea leprosula TaxID=152421 RepID=A0AAV5LEX3_9ROSI|nr:hypothetical protein SLEP1_g43883 [Rubroshorea leprosula]